MCSYDLAPNRAMIEIMACTHSIGILNNEFVGDPLDVEMLKHTKFKYDTEPDKHNGLIEAILSPDDNFKECFKQSINQQNSVNINMQDNNANRPDNDSNDNSHDNDSNDDNDEEEEEDEYEIGIIRRFEFSSNLQRMSVVTRSLTDTKFRVFTKGSPEKIKELSIPESIPKDFHQVLTYYTQNGLRVLGLACKIVDGMTFEKVQSKTRDEFEKDLVFCGLLIMENFLKDETIEVINILNDCGFKSIMITGDNALTGISVARKCGIIGPEQIVFLGDIDENNPNSINWQDIDSDVKIETYLEPMSGRTRTSVEYEYSPERSQRKKKEKKKRRVKETSFEINTDENYQNDGKDKNTLVLEKEFLEDQSPNKVRFEELKDNIVEEIKFDRLRVNELEDGDVSQNLMPSRKDSYMSKKSQEKPFTSAKRNLDNIKSGLRTLDVETDFIPWKNYKDSSFCVAVSGKAFKKFMNDHVDKPLARKLDDCLKNDVKPDIEFLIHGIIKADPILNIFLNKCLVYARMKPDQKSLAVSYVQALYSKNRILVGFCGDGANDCGALKTAHVGISLSQSEASVAAPFTSNITNISSVIEVCKEGRCALTTSFQSFKYLCYYSMVQCFGLIMLFFVYIDYSYIMYLVADLGIVFPLSLFMCYHGPYKHLTKFLPGDSLLSFPVLLSIFGQ